MVVCGGLGLKIFNIKKFCHIINMISHQFTVHTYILSKFIVHINSTIAQIDSVCILEICSVYFIILTVTLEFRTLNVIA